MFLELVQHALMITGFVFLMMLLIEYINVLSHGNWQSILKTSRWGNYILSALLGLIPGCLGAFAVVSLYAHRFVSLGALVAAMIATSGDEAFVMLAMFPREAILLTVILFVVGVVAGKRFDAPAELIDRDRFAGPARQRVEDPARLDRIEAEARRTAVENFAVDNAVDRYLEIYEEALA